MSGPSAIFLGSKAFGLTILRVLTAADTSIAWHVVHPDDGADGRSVQSEFRTFCEKAGMGFTLVRKAREANTLIAAARPGFVFVCGWYFLLPAELLASGPRFFGIHNSLLPKYRGGAPLVWAMINGEREVGSSLFGFTPGMDDGPIYLQVATAPGPEASIAEVLGALEARFADALPAAWAGITSGADNGHGQDHAAATYCGQRAPEDGRIDWREPASRVHDFIRAQSHPYPGAFSQASDRTIYFWRSRPFPASYFGTPGQLLLRSSERVVISCGGGSAIEILQATDTLGNSDLMDIFGLLRMRLGQTRHDGETQ